MNLIICELIKKFTCVDVCCRRFLIIHLYPLSARKIAHETSLEGQNAHALYCIYTLSARLKWGT